MLLGGFFVPAWIGWPLALLTAVAMAGAVEAAGVAIALRGFERKAGADRLRAAFAARWITQIHLVLLPFLIAGSLFLGDAPSPSPPSRVGLIAVAFVAFLAVRFVGVASEGRICREAAGPAATWRETAMLTVFGALTLPVYVLLAAFVPLQWGSPGAAVLVGGLALTVITMYGGWLVPFRRSGAARPASGRLAASVSEVAGRVGVRPRGVDELDAPNTNALALIVPKRLVFLGPILDVLDDAELAAITAHELGHLSEPRGVVRLRVAASLMPVWFIGSSPLAATGPYGVGLLGFNFVALMCILLAHAKAARRMEVRCDAIGREHEGEPGTYARALAKIYEANLVPSVNLVKGTAHPDLYDRLADAGAVPIEPRPQHPKADSRTLLPLAASAALAAAYVASSWIIFLRFKR